jgi:hypothetical protein
MQSKGYLVDKQEKTNYNPDTDDNKVKTEEEINKLTTTYFFPSCVIPHRIGIESVTLMNRNETKHTRTIQLNVQKEEETLNPERATVKICKKDSPVELVKDERFILTHEPGNMITTKKFPTLYVINRLQPFYFINRDGFKPLGDDSTVTFAYRVLE